MASHPRPRPALRLIAVVVLALALVQHADAFVDYSHQGKLVHRQFFGGLFGGGGGGQNSPAAAATPSPSEPAASVTPSPSLSSQQPSSLPTAQTSTSITIVPLSPSSSLALSSSSSQDSNSSSSSDSDSLSRSSRSSRTSSSDSLGSSLTPSSSSDSGLPLASASADASKDDKGMGLGKGTLITVAVIASIVGAIAAVWTVVRKWKLSPSRRFEKKLEDLDPDFYEPRPPSFGEKPQYYNMGHRRDPSFGSATNFANYGASAGTVAEPPQAHPHHPGSSAPPVWASQSGLGRSDSGGSGARQNMIGANHGGYDALGAEPFSPQQMYPHEPYGGTVNYSQVGLHPGAGMGGFDSGYGGVGAAGAVGAFRTASPAIPYRGPSPGYGQLPPPRTMSPGYGLGVGGVPDNGVHRDYTTTPASTWQA